MTRKADSCVVEYEPFEVGPHQIRVTSEDGEHVNGSPYTCNVYDAKKVRAFRCDLIDTALNNLDFPLALDTST